ncbi:MAG: cysteine--tRNA ligase [Deltaproteobacteria bacterium RBG_16_54_18]|nr:MAG: cysteine--tRNA ligase [Deltaproteobacteria bacterium RBG_16_54_18]
MALRVYNTMTQKKEEFHPLQEGRIGMYACGVTVYDLCHIGHARSAVVFDVIYRYLRYKGYEVTYVRNFTDVDDKIIKRAQEEGVGFEEIAARYIKEFSVDMGALGMSPPTIEPKATEHIPEMIALIQRLVEKGHAYQVDADVYYAVESFPAYGKLSKRTLDEMQAGARVEVDERKKNPLDFALWKGAKPGEPSWESPWGKGRPGWHIECSAMSQRYLGDTLDIHGGGKDLIFPHHENEIAQAEGATGRPFARYWLHNGFVNIAKEKMSKSLGNFLTIKDILKEYHPEVVRFFLLSRHYRSPLDFSTQGMAEARQGLTRFYQTLAGIDEVLRKATEAGKQKSYTSSERKAALQKAKTFAQSFEEAMDDDFNTAVVIAALFELNHEINGLLQHPPPSAAQILTKGKEALALAGKVLGIFQEEPTVFLEQEQQRKTRALTITPQEIEKLITERNDARSKKNWARADQIRNQLDSQGVILEDGPQGTIWRMQ